jgi:hypothetical protein
LNHFPADSQMTSSGQHYVRSQAAARVASAARGPTATTWAVACADSTAVRTFFCCCTQPQHAGSCHCAARAHVHTIPQSRSTRGHRYTLTGCKHGSAAAAKAPSTCRPSPTAAYLTPHGRRRWAVPTRAVPHYRRPDADKPAVLPSPPPAASPHPLPYNPWISPAVCSFQPLTYCRTSLRHRLHLHRIQGWSVSGPVHP